MTLILVRLLSFFKVVCSLHLFNYARIPKSYSVASLPNSDWSVSYELLKPCDFYFSLSRHFLVNPGLKHQIFLDLYFHSALMQVKEQTTTIYQSCNRNSEIDQMQETPLIYYYPKNRVNLFIKWVGLFFTVCSTYLTMKLDFFPQKLWKVCSMVLTDYLKSS